MSGCLQPHRRIALRLLPNPPTCRSAGDRCSPSTTRRTRRRSSVRARRIFRAFPSRTGRGCCGKPGKIQESRSASISLGKAIHPQLRSEIANFLGSVRGLVCSPEEVVVTSGTSGACDFCSRMILNPGDAVWVEEPGFVEARWALTAAGAKLVPIPVDDEGLVVSEGIRRAPGARLIVVTPSHQYHRSQHGPGAAPRTPGLGQ
jgi:DNA-binding transcriptional MocR family regulator